ncbi:unnamed protein product [Ambrosiozyma monospora]|uniref:Unnamed protein product n=1 Tax=Ambrosiozyma monospora TaxID=43982 RepID=A0A9W6T4J1_AMBMO|nr:unnamed protein product [Ambrosiozyma monospora]
MSIKYSLLPNWWILQFKVVIYSCCYSLLVWTTYAAFRIGETGMDILKSLRPLVLSLSPKSHQVTNLKLERQKLSMEVTQVINDLGPKVFPKFSLSHLDKISDEVNEEKEELVIISHERDSQSRSMIVDGLRSRSRSRSRSKSRSRASSVASGFTDAGDLPNLANVSIFPDALQLRDQDLSSRTSSSDLVGENRGSYNTGTDLSAKVREAVLKRNIGQHQKDDDDDDDDD